MYYSDFSGRCFGEHSPHITLDLVFGYGSVWDGSRLQLDLDDEDVKEILELIKRKLSPDTVAELEKQRTRAEGEYNDACDSREWFLCDYAHNNIALLDYISTKPTP